MNKIFKVIFNRTTGKLVVVSELTKSNGKAASSTDERVGVSSLMTKFQHQAKAALVLGLLGAGSAAVAAITEGSATGTQAVAIGFQSVASGAQSAAVGNDTKATGYGAIAMGSDDIVAANDNGSALNNPDDIPDAVHGVTGIRAQLTGAPNAAWKATTASGRASTAIGAQSQATNLFASTLGARSEATSDGATALGSFAKAKGGASFAGGFNSQASGLYSTATGAGAQATGKNSSAYGYRAEATKDNTVSVGSGAASLANNAITMGYKANTTKDSANAIAIGTLAASINNSDFAIGNKARATGGDSVAMGTLSRAAAKGGYASGIAARAAGKQSVALGWMASTGTGENTYDPFDRATEAYQEGKGLAHVAATANKTGDYSIAIGNFMAVTGSNSIGIGKAGDDRSNDSRTVANVSGDNSIAIGALNKVTTNNTIALGNNITTTTNDSIAIGNSSKVTAAGGIALGTGSEATTAAGAVGYDIMGGTNTGAAWVATDAAVSVGSATKTRQITNVAAGKNDTDAVNVAQLKKAKVEVVAGTNVTVDTDTKSGYTKYTINATAEKTVVSGTNGVKVTSKTITGGKEYVAELDDATKAKIDNLDPTALNAVKDKVNNQGITFTGNSGTTTKKLGETLNVIGDHTGTEVSAKNIKTEVLANGDLKIQMTERPDFKSATIGVDGSAKTTIGDQGISVTNGTKTVKLQPTGLDNGGNKIVNVAKGTEDTDAVNYSQLKKLENTLGLAVDENGQLTPLAKKLRDEQGNEISNGNMTTLVNNTADRVNAGLVYGGDTNAPQALTAEPTDTSNRQQLGSTFEVKSATEVLTSDATGKTGENFVGDNLTTKYVRKADGSGILSIGMTEKPNFKEVTVEDPAKPGKTTTLTPEGTTVKDTTTNKETTYGVDGLSIKGADG